MESKHEQSKETIKKLYQDLEGTNNGYLERIKDIKIPECVDQLTIQYMINRIYFMFDKLREIGVQPEELVKDEDIQIMIALYERLTRALEENTSTEDDLPFTFDHYEDASYVDVMEDVEKYKDDIEDFPF